MKSFFNKKSHIMKLFLLCAALFCAGIPTITFAGPANGLDGIRLGMAESDVKEVISQNNYKQLTIVPDVYPRFDIQPGVYAFINHKDIESKELQEINAFWSSSNDEDKSLPATYAFDDGKKRSIVVYCHDSKVCVITSYNDDIDDEAAKKIISEKYGSLTSGITPGRDIVYVGESTLLVGPCSQPFAADLAAQSQISYVDNGYINKYINKLVEDQKKATGPSGKDF